MNFEVINSKDNSKIKILKKLATKKYRKEFRRFFIESIKVINDVARIGLFCDELYVSKKLLETKREFVDELIAQVKPRNTFVMAESLVESISNLSTPTGIFAVYPFVESVLDSNSSCVYLNNINDPGNLGSILRTACALGYKNIIIDGGCAEIYNYKTLQAARDSIFKLNIVVDNKLELINKLKIDFDIIVSDLKGDVDLDDLRINKKFLVVFGNEANGVSRDIYATANYRLKINMKGNVESLNVLSAASIILYQLQSNGK
ncbi:RNA methyltransferase [Patescibacteria group bacterium]|nr:RNA methyltransferase [Patescibacteria group bacterium]